MLLRKEIGVDHLLRSLERELLGSLLAPFICSFVEEGDPAGDGGGTDDPGSAEVDDSGELAAGGEKTVLESDDAVIEDLLKDALEDPKLGTAGTPPVIPAQDAEPEPTKLLEAFRAAGMEDLTYKTDQDLLDGVKNLRSKIGERDEYAEYGKKVYEHRGAVDTFLEHLDQEMKRPSQAWNPPARLSENEWAELASKGEQAPPNIRRKYQDFEAYRQDKWDKWTAEPQTLIDELIIPSLMPVIQREFTKYQAGVDGQATYNADKEFIDTHNAELRQLCQVDGLPYKLAKEMVMRRHGMWKATEKELTPEEIKTRDLELARKKRAGKVRPASKGVPVSRNADMDDPEMLGEMDPEDIARNVASASAS